MQQARTFDYAVLALGVCAVSTAALLIREADAPSIVIAAYRLALASVPLLAVSAVRGRLRLGGGRERLLLTVLAGIFLALHFATWIASVKQTSIATSVFLVTTSPLFVALAAGPLLGERPTRAIWTGILIAAAGGIIMVGDDLNAGGDTLLGDFYALLGAVFAAAYYLIGRRLRSDGEGWLSYVTVAYSTSAVVLVLILAASGEALFDYSARTFVFFALLAAVPQLVGHTALNRSLGYMPAVGVSMAVRGEPVGATLLGVIFLSETPALLEIAGAALVMAGVYVALRPASAASSAATNASG